MLIDTRVGRLFVEDSGEGEPLVLWPSMLTDGSMWRFQVGPLREAGFRTIVIDPPGHGRSEETRRPYSLEDCADAGVEVLDALDVAAADWAGLSWGGMAGMRVALRHPERLKRLALLDTSAKRESRRKLPSYHAMAFVARRLGAVGILLDRIERIFFTPDTVAHRPDLVEPFREHLARMDPESLGHAVDGVIFHRVDLRPALSRVSAPTLVMVGAEDVATPPARAKEIAERIPGARLVELGGAGHLSALERPDEVTRELLAHFQAR